MPGVRERRMYRGIGIENAPPIGIERFQALPRGQEADEIVKQIGVEAPQRVEERDLDFAARTEKGRAQHDARDPVRMRLRISERQRRAPGAADHDPARDAQTLADHLHIRDQMRQRVVAARALWPASSGAALIEQHGMKTLGIE